MVRFSDKIAYIHHDMDDAIRGGILKETDVPEEIGDVIGFNSAEWIDHFIHDIVSNSYEKNCIVMSEPVAEAMRKLRQFMFENVYTNPKAKSEEGKAVMLIETLYGYFCRNRDRMPGEMLRLLDRGEPLERVVCDHISAMTDRYAIATFEEIYVPASWHG